MSDTQNKLRGEEKISGGLGLERKKGLKMRGLKNLDVAVNLWSQFFSLEPSLFNQSNNKYLLNTNSEYNRGLQNLFFKRSFHKQFMTIKKNTTTKTNLLKTHHSFVFHTEGAKFYQWPKENSLKDVVRSHSKAISDVRSPTEFVWVIGIQWNKLLNQT